MSILSFRLRVGALIAFCLAGFVLYTSPAHAGEVLFEVPQPSSGWVDSPFWGRGSFTAADGVAVHYRSLVDQNVCTVKHMVHKFGNPTDSLILRVYEGGSGPEGGAQKRAVTIPASDVGSVSGVYTNFPLSPCLTLRANEDYFFVFSRSLLNPVNGYISSFTNQDAKTETSYWSDDRFNFPNWTEYPNRDWSFRLEGSDTNKEPVIIVPGILGSYLIRASDNGEVWPSMVNMINPTTPSDDYLDELKLNQSGNEIVDMDSSAVIERILTSTQYGDLIDKFKNNGYVLNSDLFVFPYDWRLDISNSSAELANVVSQAIAGSPTGKVNVVAHSMGGLVVKDYLARFGDARVNKLIFVGTPHLGAPKAFNLLNYGDDFNIKILNLGLNKNKAKDIAQNMPSAYELLPSREYLDQVGSYVKDVRSSKSLSYDETNQLMIDSPLLSDHRNADLLNRGDQFHADRDSWVPRFSNIYNLIGCQDYDTIGSFSVDNGGSVDVGTTSGDGTVPTVSAGELSFGQNYFVNYQTTKIDHIGLIRDGRTIDLIYNIISGDTSVLSPGISQSELECSPVFGGLARLRFSTHSPVNLNVYDSAGNHTGLTPDGNIELGIPDSNFFQVGDNSFVFVPDGVDYNVKIDAYATGSFDFKVKKLDNDQVRESVAYNDIPIDNPDLLADFDFSDNASSSLNVDSNGDGKIDVGYNSDGSKVSYGDIEPPEIIISSPEEKEYERSSVIPANFTVTDDSGIYFASASFDNSILTSLSIDSFYSSLGSHSFSVSARDESGNGASRSVNFVTVATYDSTISDINRAFRLGWIKTTKARDVILKSIFSAMRLEERIVKIIEKMPDGKKKVRLVKQLQRRLDRVLAIALIKDLEKSYNKKELNLQAFNLIQEDIQWIVNH